MPIEQLSPELDRIVSQNQEIEELGRGYDVAEGPLWHKSGGYLLFSDIRHNLRLKWTSQEGMTVHRRGHQSGQWAYLGPAGQAGNLRRRRSTHDSPGVRREHHRCGLIATKGPS